MSHAQAVARFVGIWTEQVLDTFPDADVRIGRMDWCTYRLGVAVKPSWFSRDQSPIWVQQTTKEFDMVARGRHGASLDAFTTINTIRNQVAHIKRVMKKSGYPTHSREN